jgi:hypothetical protein
VRRRVPGSGTVLVEALAVKVPDWELVMLLPELKSAAVHVPVGQKYSWIFWGVGAVPLGRMSVKVCEKPPEYVDPPARPATPTSLALPKTPTLSAV